MFKRLIPQEYAFYDLFEQAATHTVEAARVLLKLTQNPDEADPLSRELQALEHTCDEVAHAALDRLNKSFITPLDREDIHELVQKIDDVVDLMHSAANRMVCFRPGPPPEHAVNLAKQILRGCEKMASAIHGLRSSKQYDAVARDCIAIHEAENAGDDLLQVALGELFHDGQDPLYVMKWKDIYETLERTTDRCEDVANVIQGVIVKMS